jgi:hypothetical protein
LRSAPSAAVTRAHPQESIDMRTSNLTNITVGLLVLATATPMVAADDPAATATYVTGVITESFGMPPEPVEGADAARLVMLAEREVAWSDSRLPSRMVSRALLDSYEGVHPDGSLWPSVNTVSYRLEGPDGAWSGVGNGFDVNPEWMPDDPAALMGAELITLTGEGAYAGLSAILLLHLDALDYGQGKSAFEGFIYEGEPPPRPDPLGSGPDTHDGLAEPVGPAGSDPATMPSWTATQPRLKAAREVWFDAVATLPSGEVVVLGEGMERARPARAFRFDPSDPASWEPVSLPGRKRAAAVDIAAADDELIAVGNVLPNDGPPQVLAWRSSDGRSWQRPTRIDDAEARDLLATDDGVALLGVTWDEARRTVPTLWRSTDGETFRADPVAEPGTMARRVARSPAGTWIVVGQLTTEDGYDAEHVLWRSADGRDWQTIELPFADATAILDVVAAEWTPSGFILAVNRGLADMDGATGELWHSPEGQEWTLVATSDVPFGALVTSAARQVALGSRLMGPVTDELDAAPMVVYVSSDGLDWQASRHEELDGVKVTAATLITSGEVVGVGSRSRTMKRDGAVSSTVRPIVTVSSPGDEPQSEQPSD